MNEEFPAESPEITPEQTEEFVAAIERLRPLLGEDEVEKIASEPAEGDSYVFQKFRLGDRFAIVSIAKTENTMPPEERTEGSLHSTIHSLTVGSIEKTEGNIARVLDRYMVIEGLPLQRIQTRHERDIFVQDKSDGEFKPMTGITPLAELIERNEGDRKEAYREFGKNIIEAQELTKALGGPGKTFTQDNLQEAMEVLELIA